MSFRQPGGHLRKICQQLRKIGPGLVDLVAKRLSIDVLHGDKLPALCLTNLIDMRDVWMVKAGGSLRLQVETAHTIFIGSELDRQELQRDIAVEFRVSCQVDFAHPSHTEQRAHLVMSD